MTRFLAVTSEQVKLDEKCKSLKKKSYWKSTSLSSASIQFQRYIHVNLTNLPCFPSSVLNEALHITWVFAGGSPKSQKCYPLKILCHSHVMCTRNATVYDKYWIWFGTIICKASGRLNFFLSLLLIPKCIWRHEREWMVLQLHEYTFNFINALVLWNRWLFSQKRSTTDIWQSPSLLEKCLYSELFWSVFLVSLRIQFECGKMRTRITPNTDTFYAGLSTLLGFPFSY